MTLDVTQLGKLVQPLLQQYINIISLVGKWADPGGTAIPGQPVTESEQAPGTLSPYKNQFNIEGGTWPPYQILS